MYRYGIALSTGPSSTELARLPPATRSPRRPPGRPRCPARQAGRGSAGSPRTRSPTSRSATGRTLRCTGDGRSGHATHASTGGARCRGAVASSCRERRSAASRAGGRRQRPGQQRQPRPVRPCQTRMSARPVTLGDRELMAQHQDLRVLPPRLLARQAQQRRRTGHN